MGARQITTVVEDLYATISGSGPNGETWFTSELAGQLSTDIGRRLQAQLGEQSARRTLRLSQLGAKCPRALWYSLHHPEMGEDLPPWAKIKFSYGHVIEALAIQLIKASGHEVTGEQDAVELDGIVGHRDCVVDGCVADIKSCSSRAFLKFKTGQISKDDPFGYLDQLDGYVVGGVSDPLVRVKDKGYIIAFDKTLGKVCLYEHVVRPESIKARIRDYKTIQALSSPPPCTCGTIEHGKSGNIKLDMKASYSAYKHCCFPLLRTFIYSDGPIYLTTVKKVPDVPELSTTQRTLH